MKNALMVSFMFVTHFVLGFFLTFLQSEALIIPSLSASYFEHLSVDVQGYETISTNNNLISVKKYERPDITYLQNVMEYSGRFKIRPEYSKLLAGSILKIHDKVIPSPQYIVVDHIKNGFGINDVYLAMLKEEIEFESEFFFIDFSLNHKFTIDEEEFEININDTLPIDLIFHEPKYFASPKLYLSQEYVDQKLGSYELIEGQTLNNYLLNIDNDHAATNYRFRLHFVDNEQKMIVEKLLKSATSKDRGIELTSDEINKVNSFRALYDYLNILVTIFFIFIIIVSLVMHGIVAHTSLLALQKQLALLQILGGTKGDLLSLFLGLNFFNFCLGLSSNFILPLILPLLSSVIFTYLNVSLIIILNWRIIFYMILISLLIVMILLITLFLLNTRRPLLYLLIDA